MAKIIFPMRLESLLEGSKYQPSIRALADRVGEILSDNKLPFFPDYTDHGVDHINCVLKSEVELVPDKVWEQSTSESSPRLLCDADAVVIIGATLLHDIAMHLRENGFLELIGKDSRYKPISWFNEDHEGHLADRPWYELWDDYVREVRRFSERDLGSIIGEQSAHDWKFEELPENTGRWELNHRLIIGEFIRRHHARLAHEVAIYGFPGLPVGAGEHQFPAMGTEDGHMPKTLADLIGLTARSHGTTLRVCKAYLDASPSHAGTLRPMGTAVLYPMALLRVADYLQLDNQRAPAVLLQLRNPQSPISVQEWKKHRAVQYIGPATDPGGKMVTVSTDISLSLYLQLRDLLAGLQAEMDQSTAVLDEAYGDRSTLESNKLGLATRRVHSNLNSPTFRNDLPFIPEKTGFAADPDLLTLLVEPLYGKEPGVGVRELIQNAADAVCELEAWRTSRGIAVEQLDLPEQDGDVLVEFIERKEEEWILRVSDRGIGMDSNTIQNYFLRAGASFRRSPAWAKEFLDDEGQPRALRAGRFGIGVFAVFLLGERFRMSTRHAGAKKEDGYTVEASANSQTIEIKRTENLPNGTAIEVVLSKDSSGALGLYDTETTDWDILKTQLCWFCWDWPNVVTHIVRGSRPEIVESTYALPIRKRNTPPEWSVIHPDGFDAVYWSYSDAPKLSCNGFEIAEPGLLYDVSNLEWAEHAIQLELPNIAVIDRFARLPLTIQRYGLSQESLPFERELARDVTLSFIAHALVCGPESRIEALSPNKHHPLQTNSYETFGFNYPKIEYWPGKLRWCATPCEMVPADPWHYSLLGVKSYLVYGALYESNSDSVRKEFRRLEKRLQWPNSCGCAVSSWHGTLSSISDEEPPKYANINEAIEALKEVGILAVCHDVVASQILYSPITMHDADFFIKLAPGEIYQRPCYEIGFGDMAPSISLQEIIDTMDSTLSKRNILFAAEFRTGLVEPDPTTLIAKVWDECLGPRAIPFEPEARKALIEHGRIHTELKRHIDAWEQLKESGSKWVTGK